MMIRTGCSSSPDRNHCLMVFIRVQHIHFYVHSVVADVQCVTLVDLVTLGYLALAVKPLRDQAELLPQRVRGLCSREFVAHL